MDFFKMETLPKYDLPRILFGCLFILLMLMTCLWVARPFILSLIWAGLVVIATWPLLILFQRWLRGSRRLAVLVLTLLLVILFFLPLVLMGTAVLDSSAMVMDKIASLKGHGFPDLAWLKSIPFIGAKLYAQWQAIIVDHGQTLVTKLEPHLRQWAATVLTQLSHLGQLFVHGILMLVISAVLYAKGESISLGIRHFATRLASDRGDAAVILAAQSIRAVAMGVVVTAVVQSVLGGIGLAICGVSGAMLLTVLMFVLCLAQLGPVLVMLPATAWLFWHGDTSWGSLLLVWSIVVGGLDNFLRPMLIRMGADLPMLLILTGVIGGLLAFGMIGLFIGPAVLAVSYRLMSAWVSEVPAPSALTTDAKHSL